MCDRPWSEPLQRAYVLESNHPRCKLQLNGRTLSTPISQKGAWLAPCFAPGQFAPDQDDPFSDIRMDILYMGLFGIHVDTRLESFLKVQEAKEYAKAVKADGAEIPVWLWNDRVRADRIPHEHRDLALNGFWTLGYKWFRQQLTRDVSNFMVKNTARIGLWLIGSTRKGTRLSLIGLQYPACCGTPATLVGLSTTQGLLG